MDRAEIKNWAKEKIKGHIWELFITMIVVSILTTLTIGGRTVYEDGQLTFSSSIPLGIFFYFVEVGFAYYMVKFITDKKYEFKDIFYYSKDYVRTFLVGLLNSIFIFLWTLLFIIPGIIKAFAYTLVPFILADEKYKDLGYLDVIKKSEEIMKGHKGDLFVFELSFIGWHLLAICTLGILYIWLLPYYKTAKYKFLYDIKTSYEKK